MPAGRPVADGKQRERARAIQRELHHRMVLRMINLEQLARAAEVNRRTLDKYFQGDSPSPSFFLVAGLATVLEVSLDDLARLEAEK